MDFINENVCPILTVQCQELTATPTESAGGGQQLLGRLRQQHAPVRHGLVSVVDVPHRLHPLLKPELAHGALEEFAEMSLQVYFLLSLGQFLIIDTKDALLPEKKEIGKWKNK